MGEAGAYGEELGGVGKPGLNHGGCVENYVAAGEGGEEGVVVGDVAVDEFEATVTGW